MSAGLLDCARDAGFNMLLWANGEALWEWEGSSTNRPTLDQLSSDCSAAGLRLIAQVDLSRFPVHSPLVQAHPDAFAIRRAQDSTQPVDPRKDMPLTGEAIARLRQPGAADMFGEFLADRLIALAERGLGGIRLAHPHHIGPAFLQELIGSVRSRADFLFLAGPGGADRENLRQMALAGTDLLISSYGWWDFNAPWFVEEVEALRGIAPLVSEVRDDQPASESDTETMIRRVTAAAATGNGIIVPHHFLANGPDMAEAAARATAIARDMGHLSGEVRRLTGSASHVTALLRIGSSDLRTADEGRLVFINKRLDTQPPPPLSQLLEAVGNGVQIANADDVARAEAPLAPGEVRILRLDKSKPILGVPSPEKHGAAMAATWPRLVVEDISPSVEGGDFPAKRIVGEAVTVEATIFADGHEQLAAQLHWREADRKDWSQVRMQAVGNDRWTADFPLRRLGAHEFAIEAWLDRFGGFQRDFLKKLDAGVAVATDYAEGRELVESARRRSRGRLKTSLEKQCKALTDTSGRAADVLLSHELTELMHQADHRPHCVRSAVRRVDAERLAARYSSWYELFPRSITNDKSRHGTFADVIARLPAIREMGFDTLYFPPIHPIGTTNRKGPNNTLTPEPHDVGSPYAIGSHEGGHDALHPELGSFQDFHRLVEAARAEGIEIALDFAIQCAPDHPWLKEHPGWFSWRPDGSMKYAENPPKKYQDIVNVDFYGPDAVPDLWKALRDVVLFWIGHGIKAFRVDNPHTKPLPFWQWMIAEIRAEHPDVIFLSEAFTRPTMMYRLAKVGFSQSYTYFTWRDRKQELIDYITELTTTAPKDFYRPHFFVNTPDINPHFLQTSGRPGFQIRAVLAATLSGLFGVYSGFELCEAAALPGREEYLNSEKYEIRPRDYSAPGNIIADITLLNQLRHSYPALQTHLNTRFYVAHNDQVIWYGKPAADGSDIIMVMVSLDPHHGQDVDFEVPLWEFDLPDHGAVAVEDLVQGHRFQWQGKVQHLRIEPALPYRIWRIEPEIPA